MVDLKKIYFIILPDYYFYFNILHQKVSQDKTLLFNKYIFHLNNFIYDCVVVQLFLFKGLTVKYVFFFFFLNICFVKIVKFI